MSERYHGKIKNASAQKVTALYGNSDRAKAKEASYSGNGAKAFDKGKK